ncbi:hypothetical protein LEP1GSC195_1558 [Leptospira wolbachii serovar Codice str. CDC]|uniref:Uncharacterized protein n=1 Tax=Leptospira wolbachii serovar Codice str. CDC TaxID=1218599 RepID=R9A341_9LEPT|nr:hypothetical protein LEP1GSC195_1558 [Leptospira wolbachii serovar Codice str. CDC]
MVWNKGGKETKKEPKPKPYSTQLVPDHSIFVFLARFSNNG